MSQGPLHLVAISKLGESDAQLRSQLDAMYMQILSTLTLPTLTHLFANRPSTDLRRPLKGTEVLLSGLADSFTRGSSSALLSALECLRLRKRQRNTVNETMLRHRTKRLLYGLVVAGGRLVSVARPRKHSLHPSDLQLIFNMLYEADGIKEGGGENWIPICLPGFNKDGYLYMYVSFVSTSTASADDVADLPSDSNDTVVVILISADRESFYELRDMRNAVVDVGEPLFLSVAYLRQSELTSANRTSRKIKAWMPSVPRSGMGDPPPQTYYPAPSCDTSFTSPKVMFNL